MHTATLEDTIIGEVLASGNMLRRVSLDVMDIEMKKHDDPVTIYDKMVEERIAGAIQPFGVNIVGEEYGNAPRGSSTTVYIDPIDGTKSWARREFLSSITIAVEREGQLSMGCVYDFMRDILYYADQHDIYIETCNDAPAPHRTRVGGGRQFLSKPTISIDDDSGFLQQALIEYDGRKRIGSIALGMAQLACLDAYEGLVIAPKKKAFTHDIAAGYYLLTRAGYTVTDIVGKPFDYTSPTRGIIAAKPELHAELLADIEEHTAYKRHY